MRCIVLETVDSVYDVPVTSTCGDQAMFKELTPGALDRVVDSGKGPPVTLGGKDVSVAGDSLQHAGGATCVRGPLGI
jgi:hypothetical protein